MDRSFIIFNLVGLLNGSKQVFRISQTFLERLVNTEVETKEGGRFASESIGFETALNVL